MHLTKRNLTRLQCLSATMLLLAMVFQLGACPCGCIDHNAWVQLWGVESEHHKEHTLVSLADDDGNSSIALARVSDSHDCTGQPRSQFCDNACSVRVHDTSLIRLPESFVAASYSSRTRSHSNERLVPSTPVGGLCAAPSLPQLQVYRL